MRTMTDAKNKAAKHAAQLAGEDGARAGVEGSPEVFDEGGAPQAPAASKKNGLPDEPLRRSLTDTDLIVSESTGRQFRRQWDADGDGVEITGTETWVEVTQRGASEIEA